MNLKTLFTLLTLCVLVLTSCGPAAPAATSGGKDTPAPSATTVPPTATASPTATAAQPPTETPTPVPSSTATPKPPTRTPAPTWTPAPLSVEISVQAAAPGKAFSPVFFGSNLPAWLKPSTFEDEQFIQRVRATGVQLLRIPGGSWGDEYGWLSCETGKDVPGAVPCRAPWAARPSDFIKFFQAQAKLGLDIEAQYIVNHNYTAQEAAALVAFFNAPVGSATLIGLDRNGTDWKTAGEWAALRAAGGSEQPLGVKYWEIGNEVYGGKAGDANCGGNGWEETWTCNAGEYMLGNDSHDGALALIEAMKKVDASILAGIVGGTDSVMGNTWAETVLKAGLGKVDYFVIHSYPYYHIYGNAKKEYNEILSLPQYQWRTIRKSVDDAYTYYAGGETLPLVINEFDIAPPYGQVDTRNFVNKYIDALFLADSFGQMLTSGVELMAHWDVMNGEFDEFGNEWGLMKADGKNTRQPKYWAYPLWTRFGSTLLPVVSSARPETELSVYAGRLDDGTITLMVINKTEVKAISTIALDGVTKITGGKIDQVTSYSLEATLASYNGRANPADDLSDAPPYTVSASDTNQLSYTFPPLSITLFRLEVQK